MNSRNTTLTVVALALAVAAYAAEETSTYWAPPSVPSGALGKRFDRTCSSDPRAHHEAASKRPPTLASSAAYKVPAVPASFRRAHPELRSEKPSFTTVMALLVNEEGRVVEARVERSSGHEELDREAVEIAGNWRFNAAQVDGKPVCAWGRLGATMKWLNSRR